jgi:REP element-mobilizing transposase RayT
MRQTRIRIDFQDTWHHCYNRIAGTSQDLPFGDEEKEKFVRILKRVSVLYSVRVVAYQVMSNHFHLLVHAPAAEPTPEETCRRYKAFHHGKRTLEIDTLACRIWQSRCRDVSWFMRHLQHLFTAWYNRSRSIRRRGSLWADRFKNTILEDGFAVWSCWSYIENNPVRANMVQDAADYRFCTHGAWHQTGRHPFEENVRQIMLPLMQGLFGISSLVEIRNRMDQFLADKSGREPVTAAFSLTVQRRVRHWTSGLVIGSELFVRDVMTRYRAIGPTIRHRVAHPKENVQYSICAWRRLRQVE